MVTIIGIVLGILGLLASMIGSVLAYFTFVDPRKRLSSYLGKVDNWESVSTSIGGHEAIWRYNKHPEFVIEIKDDSRDWDSEVTEPWMTMPLRDLKITMYMVHATINGTVLYAEKFIALDGWRYFVPLPRIKTTNNREHEDYDSDKNEDAREFYFDETQVQLSRIIGKFHGEKSIEVFAKHSKIKVIGENQ